MSPLFKKSNRFNLFYSILSALICVSIFCISCKSDAELLPTLNDGRDSSTIQMAIELQNWYKTLTPENSNYISGARAKLFKEIAATSTGIERLTYDLRSEFETLKAGRSKESIEGFIRIDSICKAWGIAEDQPVYRKTAEFRAVGHLRIGEQENCLNNHSENSCIIPLLDNAVHQLTEGSTIAITEIEKLLAKGDDLNLRWVLNIAYMTLGKYPEGVPKEYYIPLSHEEIPGLLQGRFTNIASLLGIDDNRLSGGVIIEDFDNDLDLDIMVSSWSLEDQVYYYENDGNGHFINKYKQAGIEGITGGLSISHGDYNNDGFFDVLITRGAWLGSGTFPNSLLRNNQDGSFTDVTKESGIYSLRPTQTSTWADFNNDGYIDIFIGNESYSNHYNNPCELWLNQKDGTFKDVAKDSGTDIVSFIKGAATSDYDNDGDIDIYLSNMSGDNFFLRNDWNLGDGLKFTNIAEELNLTKPSQSFPCWFFDVNNDGWDDIYVSGFAYSSYGSFGAELAKEMLGQSNNVEKQKLYINDGKGGFIDASESYGLNTTCYTMGSSFGDINNDGFKDFYLGTGEPDFKALVPNRMFLNREGQSFAEVTAQGGFGHIQKGHGISFADLDNDGDEDVYAVMGGAYEGDIFYNALFENPGTENQWVKFKLEGTQSNKVAYGAKLTLHLKNGDQSRKVVHTISSGSSFGESPSWCHLGFYKNENIEKIDVRWPSGISQSFKNIEPAKFYKITEGKDSLEMLDFKKIPFMKSHKHHNH